MELARYDAEDVAERQSAVAASKGGFDGKSPATRRFLDAEGPGQRPRRQVVGILLQGARLL